MKTLTKLFVCIAIALSTTSCIFFTDDPHCSMFYDSYKDCHCYRYCGDSYVYGGQYAGYGGYSGYYGYAGCSSCSNANYITVEYVDYYWPAQRANGEYCTMAIGRYHNNASQYVRVDITGYTGIGKDSVIYLY